MYDFFGDKYLAPGKCGPQPPVAVATVIVLKDICDGNPSISVFVRSSKPVALIKVRAAGKVKLDQET